MRILADKANESSMLEAFRDGADLHSLTASRMYSKEVSSTVNTELRKDGKILNFAIPYGAGADKVASQFGLPMKAAQKLVDLYFKGYPEVKKLFATVIEETFSNGYISVDRIGRRSYIHDFDKFLWLDKKIHYYKRINFPVPKDYQRLYLSLKGEIERTSQNYVIQGEAASITKLAGILLRKERLKNPIFDIVLSVHDEMVLECDIKDATRVKKLLERCMLDAAAYFCKKIPIPADGIISVKWYKK